MTRTLVFAVVFALAGVAQAKKTRLLVMKLNAQRGVDADVGLALNDLIATQFADDPQYEVLDSAAVAALVDQDQQRQLLGCDAVSCLAEIGAAMGVDLLVESSLSAIGNSYLLNIKIIDSKNVRVLRRISKQIPKDEKFLLDGVIAAVRELEERDSAAAAEPATSKPAPAAAETVAEAPVAAAAAPVVAATEAPLPSPGGGVSLTKIVGWSLVAVGAVSAAFGGVSMVQGLGERSKLKTVPESETALRTQHEGNAKVYLLRADVFGLGGAAAAGAGLLMLWLAGDDEATAMVPWVSPGSAGIAARLTF